jgi:hypothetical protein
MWKHRWRVAIWALAFASAGVAGGEPATDKIYDPDTLNALPAGTAIEPVRVRGVFAINTDTDGPYLYQDMRSYGLRGGREHMVTIPFSLELLAYVKRYEAALVIITGKYRKSGCREPKAICPHMSRELFPSSVEVIGYPDKAPAEQVNESGREPLREVVAGDPDLPPITDLSHRLVRAVAERDIKAVGALADPENAKNRDYRLVGPGSRIYWHLFDPEAAFVSEENRRPAFKIYEYPYRSQDEVRAVAICFDKGKQANMSWPDSQFDLDAHNVGDPYACITAARSARGWQLHI